MSQAVPRFEDTLGPFEQEFGARREADGDAAPPSMLASRVFWRGALLSAGVWTLIFAAFQAWLG